MSGESQSPSSKDECEYKVATTQSDLKRHIESVHEKVKYPCNQCEKQFTQQGNLRKHIESVHEKVKHPCYQCGKQFTQQGHLKGHIRKKHFSK